MTNVKLWEYDGKVVIVYTKDSESFKGFATYNDKEDFEEEQDSLSIMLPDKSSSICIYENEIERIEEIS
ncbi:hypothetical protein [Aeribacillus phage AP45]|uniref:Uncharacterized protein n=1 Tax=Aeribacillus phage AP45 TaxID=1913112 RepID=A0A1L2JY54_9CAUD|nr:hypothetical protein HWD36_gp47 [Aeribacillus phage AP45]APC46496.1 hypothetical protein [Aeribacillus phage AP45]